MDVPFQPIRATQTNWAVTGSPCCAQPGKEVINIIALIFLWHIAGRRLKGKMSAVPNLTNITLAFVPTYFSFFTSRLVYTITTAHFLHCPKLPTDEGHKTHSPRLLK